jgi:purine-binding chemotaxis protein CheW
MDLAKIRQKAQQSKLDTLQDSPLQPCEEVTGSADTGCVSLSASVEADQDFYSIDPTFESCQQSQPAAFLQHRHVSRSPLEVILAGRDAAGCNEEVPLASIDQVQLVPDSFLEFLCFRVSDELYGINIMDIKELIKPREVTEVPRAPSFVQGVISLRGTIIPVIDMLDRLGLQQGTKTGRERVIVVRNGDFFSGLLVDEIIQVVRISKDCLESTPTVLEGIDRDFVSGIGRADGRMIILLNLANIADINLY